MLICIVDPQVKLLLVWLVGLTRVRELFVIEREGGRGKEREIYTGNN